METNNELPNAAEQEPTLARVALGSRLRAVRHQTGLSRLEVQTLSCGEFQANTLSSYERGERTITVPRLQRLATLYKVPVHQLLPPADVSGLRLDEDRGLGSDSSDPTALGRTRKVTIDLTKPMSEVGPEGEVLRRFLSMVQVQRQDFNGRMITIRAGDVLVIACNFGIPPDALVRRLHDLGLLVQSRPDIL
jgi:transcriptional regulator with XRE-family HTH domain